jgi:hypothetical protein
MPRLAVRKRLNSRRLKPRKLNQTRALFKILTIIVAVHIALRATILGHEGSHYEEPKYFACSLDDLRSESMWNVNWVDEQTKRFTKLWANHKIRNVVLYSCLATRRIPVLKYMLQHLLNCPKAFYSKRHDRLFQVPKFCVTHNCLRRFGQSHYVYAEFVLKIFDEVTKSTLSPPRPSRDGNIAVLVEPREHPLFEFTVKQVMHTLGENWALQIFVSSKNIDFVRKKLNAYGNESGRHIVLTRLGDFGLDELSFHGNRAQSALSAHRRLYEAILGEHILWFQLDVVMRSAPPTSWLGYAYVGAEWRGCEYPTCSNISCGAVCGGGNSGLSLRRRSKLFRVSTGGDLPQDLWGNHASVIASNKTHESNDIYDRKAHFLSDNMHDNSIHRWFEDDLQLSYKLSKLGELPPSHVPPRFAFAQALPAEGFCATDPVGLHKPWLTPWIQPQIIMNLLARPFEYSHAQEA